MYRRLSLGLLGALGLLLTGERGSFGQDAEPIGVAPGSRARFAQLEAHALAVPTPDHLRKLLRTLTEEPHVAGTPASYKIAIFVRDKLREWGWHAELAEYEVLLNGIKPGGKAPYLVLRSPAGEKQLSLVETPLRTDKDSASTDALPAFHGYGISGSASGDVVYANYGRPEDFAALEKLGIDVEGKIVLVRYGELFRGLKLRNAQKRGARGILMYSDPADDGYARGDIYPAGPYRPGSSLQRGSVQFLSLAPGDPSTPDGPSVKGAKRLPFDREHGFTTSPRPFERHLGFKGGGDAPLEQLNESVLSIAQWEKATGLKREDYFAMIPSLPISYDAARPILEALAGPNAPSGWQGGLPFAYHTGPGPAQVSFGTETEYAVRSIWNVIATLEGTVEPDRWVMLGNHHDAWVFGAVDPSSGTAATLETCRALGAAVKAGWKPHRTIVYASWDAEEYGLVGSTEWAEEHAAEIAEKAVLLLNVDSAVAGPDLDLDGVPSLRDLVLDAAAGIRDVRSGKSLRQLWVAQQRAEWARRAPLDLFDPLWERAPAAAAAEHVRNPRFIPQMNWLGSGSDYTAFLDHLGVPALDIGFRGKYGVYHSIYDNFTWMEKFGDPEFLTHATAAKLYTAILLRAAWSEVVPLKFAPYGEALRDHVDDLRRMVQHRAWSSETATAKPAAGFDGLPQLVAAVKAFQEEAAALDRATDALALRKDVANAGVARVNDALKAIERTLLLPDGLPGRRWFKHAIYAPGLTTGYASWPLPGVRQAILENDPKLLAQQLAALIERIASATKAMKNAEEEANRQGAKNAKAAEEKTAKENK